MMKRPDFVTSRVKKRRHLMMSIRSSLDDCDESTSPSGTFNLDCYNSLNKQQRLNRFKSNRRLIRCRHVPPRVSESDDQDLTAQSDVSRCATSLVTKNKH